MFVVFFLKINRFEGVFWNCDEIFIVYVVEEFEFRKFIFNNFGYESVSIINKGCNNWKG